MYLFLWYPKCSTCRKAAKWLKEHDIEIQARDIRAEGPTKSELQDWHTKSGLDIKRFFNTSGNVYKELHLKEKLGEMSLDEKFTLLASDPMLVKRPLLIAKNKVLIGFKEQEWNEVLLK